MARRLALEWADGDFAEGGDVLQRRRFLLGAAGMALVGSAFAAAEESIKGAARIGLSPVFLDDQLRFLASWRAYLQERLARPVEFVQRRTYREITDLLLDQKLEFAWICGYPYVKNRAELQLVAVPLSEGHPTYHSYLIVPGSDRDTHSILDLRGKIFAFSDPDSNSGFLYPNYVLVTLAERPDAFFGKTFFTWAHRNTVEAIAAGLAHGGAVDSYVWETLKLQRPQLGVQTRVAASSPEFGHTPFVARRGVARSEWLALQRALIDMRESSDGVTLLSELNLDGFVPGSDSLYDGIARMMQAIRGVPLNAPAA
jgi:phosphonate transport system substrate-binding protein